MNILSSIRTWWGRGGAIAETVGQQNGSPGTALVENTQQLGVDRALQLDTVWACIDRRSTTVASLPYFVYKQIGGEKQLARMERLFTILHDSPNSRMTPFEFWRAMVMNHDLRGNAYARVDRDDKGEAMALWPMPADQVDSAVLPDGSMVYQYRLGNDVAVLAEENVLHLKNLGNGTTGLSKLDFMRATLDGAAKIKGAATAMYGNGGKPTGVLMLDKVLKKEQRDALLQRFAEMAVGNTSRLYVLEADMKYQQLSLTPEQLQLLEHEAASVEEICRWFDVPPVLVHHANVTAWGSGVEQLIQGFYTLAIRPLLVNFEQAVRKRVFSPRQRVTLTAEFSFDALLRANPKDRNDIYAKQVQNGIKTRAEIRQLEGDPYIPGTDVLTAQSNLVPLDLLGKVKVASTAGDGSNIAQ